MSDDTQVARDGGAPLRLGAVLGRLEEIRRDLDREDLELEDQMQLYREGCALVVRARKILDQATSEVEVLMGETERAPSGEAE
ncbi:MAG TPA: exodeoxyribonuclease VII small subunit [Longimicrobiaceae bacterium]|nr:exodeoxyribonuclease VII small subunit [Longimicrobiaceae bacterium]